MGSMIFEPRLLALPASPEVIEVVVFNDLKRAVTLSICSRDGGGTFLELNVVMATGVAVAPCCHS